MMTKNQINELVQLELLTMGCVRQDLGKLRQ